MRRAAGALFAIVSPLAAAAASGVEPARDVRHVLYLHGRIVQEQQSARPRSPQYGFYELEKILAALRAPGFAVTGGIRPKSASMEESAGRVASEVRALLAGGVPPDRIAVVGASMGAGIAIRAAARLQNPRVRFAVLGACFSETARAFAAEEGRLPSGRVLAIREESDESTRGCPPWQNAGGADAPLVVREIVLRTGLDHGFLYRPLPDWVQPVVAFVEAP